MIGWEVNDDEQTRTNIHALSGIWTHSLSIQTIKAYASERVATGTRNVHSLLHGIQISARLEGTGKPEPNTDVKIVQANREWTRTVRREKDEKADI
jgi:hypothetical protein